MNDSVRPRVAFFDTKPYDREHFLQSASAQVVDLRFLEHHLNADTASTAEGCTAACAFVNDRIDRPCLEALARVGVRLVALRCAGFNNLDLQAARELGITAVRVPAYSPHAVAEHTVGLLLTLNRRIHRAYNRVREHNFALSGLVGFDLHGRTVGVIGTGRIGRVFARILRGFEAQVVAFDPLPDPAWAAANGIRYTGLDELLGISDVVSLHVPLLPSTRHLIRAETVARMKPGAFLLNTSRGQLIDTTAVIDGLKSGQLGGVALDVYEEEEGLFFEDHSDKVLQDDELSRLLTFPNVLITAHQAFLTEEALTEIARVTCENVARFGRGEPLLPGTSL